METWVPVPIFALLFNFPSLITAAVPLLLPSCFVIPNLAVQDNIILVQYVTKDQTVIIAWFVFPLIPTT